MKYTVIPPCKELKDLISHFWVATWDAKVQEANTNYYIVANSLTEITFAFRSNEQKSELLFSSVQGHAQKPDQFPVEGFFQLFGVSLYSYAVPGLFKIPASELNNEYISLTTFLGYEGEVLNEKIALAGSTHARIKILTDYFMSLLSKPRIEDNLISKAIKQIKQCNGNKKITELSAEMCLSQKQFERRFKEFSGFSPKIYARIIRFESFLNTYTAYANLTEAAYGSGYYDQSHFIHEFKAFTGYSPNVFFKLSEEPL